ncbi:MAG: nucleoside-diphosphate kinase [Candidatus Pacebacteria bacterium]|nr:nucleoside-diphosphate kinase [Candidatus Paceibacterota bacterium]
MQNEHPREEKTFVLIKPDGVKRGLIGEIINRIEERGLKIAALEMVWAKKDQIDNHYPKDENWIRRLGEKTLANYKEYNIDPIKELGTDDPMEIGKNVRSWLIDYMTSGPMVKMVIEGIHAIAMMRKIVGKSIPSQAEMGTIRGDFSIDDAFAANKEKRAIHNLVHASENEEEAEHEINLWFAPEEIHYYKRAEEELML